MSSVRDPQAKKALSYVRDHRVRGGENDKAFRRKWPIKKRKVARAWRHAANGLVRRALTEAEPDTDTRLIPKVPLTKWGVISLEQSVACSKSNRQGRALRRAQKRKTAPPETEGAVVNINSVRVEP